MSMHRCGRECAGHDPHFIQVRRASGWQPITIGVIEGDDIHIRLHGGEERVVRNHDTGRLQRLLRTPNTGCWISGGGNLLSIDKGPAQSYVFSVTTGELGECGQNGRPGTSG
jgi:hypothetical protein